MQRIRIGNDIAIEWTITRLGSEEGLEGKDLSLSIRTPRGRIPVEEYLVEGSTLRFSFPGKDQALAGCYGLLLQINAGKESMTTVEACKAFMLVEDSCGCGAEEGDGIVVTCNSDVTVPANGLSAYETAVLHGYEGTEEDWIEGVSNGGGGFTWKDWI